MNNQGREQAEFEVRKAFDMPFQEISVLDADLTVIGRATLTQTQPDRTFKVDPGRYVVIGMAPSGARSKNIVELVAGASEVVYAESNTPSPHEWLAGLASRHVLPESDIILAHNLGLESHTRSVGSLRQASPMDSFSMPAPEAYSILSERGVAKAIDRRIRSLRPKRDTRRKNDVSIRTYNWSGEHGRWLRSALIEEAEGEYAPDYTRMRFPGRDVLNRDLSTAIHLLGAFVPDQPARFIALPLFAHGAQLVLSMRRSQGGADKVASQHRAVTWRLSAIDEDLDGLLQAVDGRNFGDREAVSNEALRLADRVLFEKKRDPEAATVAGYLLLQHKTLDQRARWVENLASWFPWSPDALVLGAWGNLLFDTGSEGDVLGKLAAVYRAGPPQLAPSRRLLRDLVSLNIDDPDQDLGELGPTLQKLWKRIGRESKRAVSGGPFYSFERDFSGD